MAKIKPPKIGSLATLLGKDKLTPGDTADSPVKRKKSTKRWPPALGKLMGK